MMEVIPSMESQTYRIPRPLLKEHFYLCGKFLPGWLIERL